MKKIILGIWLALVATLSLAQFNPSQPYATVANACGGLYYLQGSTYYDTHGNSYGTLPACTPPAPNAPGGTAGGDLTGTYPNPTVSRAGGYGLPRVIAQSAVAASVTGTTTETALATISIPAGTLGVNGSLRITTLWSCTNNADNKTATYRLGGTFLNATVLTSVASMQHQVNLRNRGVLNSQVNFSNTAAVFQSNTSTVNTTSVDTSQTQSLTITGTLATSTDTITLEGYTVEVLNP